MSCTLLEPPKRPLIPTAVPTAPAVISLDDLQGNQPVVNPFSAVTMQVDNDILTLLNNVSQQNLIAYVQHLESFGTRHTFSETQQPNYGIGAARNWIYTELNRVGGGRLQVAFDDFIVNDNGLTSSQQNIVATLPGVGPHPGIIVMMAHYDSRTFDMYDPTGLAPGANDNGSGVAAMIEVARLMSSRSWNQTVVFVAFAAEEQGTYGSRHFVQNALIREGLVIDAGINNDIVGGRPGISQSIRIFSPGPDNSPSRQLARYFHLIGGIYLPEFGISLQNTLDRDGRFSDHRTFIDAGIGAVRLTESEENFNIQHSSSDTSDRMDYSYLAQVTRLNLATVANMAGAPPPPVAPTVSPMADPGVYLVTWPTDSLAAGYVISFRPLTDFIHDPTNFHYISAAEAGNVALTGLDPALTYGVSLAALDGNGRISSFSPEIIVGP